MKQYKPQPEPTILEVREKVEPYICGTPTETVTGQSDATLALFAGIHNSTKFSLDAAHKLFGAVRQPR